jgi:3-hydroxyacyl-CoA dehydrogenase
MSANDVKKLVVIGAGTMGSGIAYIAAVGGIDVDQVDLDPSALDGA